MKVAVIKLGGRIANEGHGITSFEAVSISKMLSIGGLHHADCYTKISDKDLPIPELNIFDITKHYNSISGNYDALIVINGNINFYGGAETSEQLMNLHVINNFQGPVFYVFIDTLLPLKNVWESIKAKPWSKKYEEKNMNITRDDIIYITMCYDTEAVFQITEKTGINPKKIVYFPFEKYPFFSERLNFIGTKTIDLIYGANSFRNKREKKMVKYYFDLPSDISGVFYGKMKLEDFKPSLVAGKILPKFEGPIQFKENLQKMNSAIATINISDTFNEGRQLNPRIYETVLANVVSFMDLEYDPQKRAFSDKFLQDFLYVKNQKELVEKLRQLKADPDFMIEVLKAQYEDSYISKEDLSKQFCKLIEDLYLENAEKTRTINNIEIVDVKSLKPKALF